jgi:hypothetical protein
MRNGRRMGAAPKPYTPPATPQGKINTTDADLRNVKTPRGWVQGYNAQAATNERQIVIAAELTNSSADFGQIGPMVDAAHRELAAAGVAEPPQIVLADAGYWHQVQMQALAGDGIQVLIPPDANKRKGTRPGWSGGLYAFMRRVLQTPTGAELYGKRNAMIEPVFGHTKVQPQDRPLPTPRTSRLPLGMAPHHGHVQPAQAPPGAHETRSRLASTRRARPARPSRSRPATTRDRRARRHPAPTPSQQRPCLSRASGGCAMTARMPNPPRLASGRSGN